VTLSFIVDSNVKQLFIFLLSSNSAHVSGKFQAQSSIFLYFKFEEILSILRKLARDLLSKELLPIV
jgi:hypothetical protein